MNKKHITYAVIILAVVVFASFVKVFTAKDNITKETLLDKLAGK